MSIWCTPEGQDMIESDGVEIGILEDVDVVIPHHKLMVVDLPKDRYSHEA
jgi:hypothetical protein